jgi:DNA-directed RNA polymerase subunit beta'
VEVTRSSVRRERMGHIDLSAPVAHVWYTRRIPSYLGLLLDISRRNLDRVLYFAQYVVTYVDEDARQKAQKRLEDNIATAEREFGGQINAKIAETKARRDRKLAELEQRKVQVGERYDESIASQLEPIIQDGQSLERTLQERMGKTPRKAIVFPQTDTVIAEADELISNEHLARVQKVVKEHLEELKEI